MSNKAGTQQIVEALEAHPSIEIPDDFARRVMSRLPETYRGRRHDRPAMLQTGARFGRTAVLVTMAALLAGMVLLAPHSRTSPLWLGLQSLLFLQFCGLVLWTARIQHTA